MAQPTTALQQIPLPSSQYAHSLEVMLPQSSHSAGLGLEDNLLSRELTQSVAVGQGNKTEIDHGGQVCSRVVLSCQAGKARASLCVCGLSVLTGRKLGSSLGEEIM